MTKRALKTNFVINTLGAIVPLFIALVTVPIYVRHIGDARYGVLSIVWILLGYFGFLDLGLSRAAANALARLRDAPQNARAQVLVTTLVLNLGLGLLGSLCLAFSGGYLLQHVLNVPDALKPEIASAFPWIVGLFLLALVSGVGIGALESRERFLLANLLQVTGASLGQIAPVLIAVTISPSLALVIPAAAITRGVTVAATLIAVYRDEGPLTLAAFDPSQARKLLSYGGWVTVSGLVSPLLVSLDQFVIGSMLGVAAVTHYAVPMNLVTRSQIFAASLSRTLFPRMSSSTRQEAQALASRSLLMLSYGYASICAPAMVLTPLFFRHWISPEFASIAAPVAEILFFGAWINGLAFVPFGLLQSQGRPDVTGKLHLAEVLPFAAVLWYLVSRFGIPGAAAAWSLRCAIDAFCLFWAARMQKLFLMRAVVVPLLCLTIAVGLASELRPELWETIGAAIAVGILVIGSGIFFVRDVNVMLSIVFLASFRLVKRA